ncbi:hypothetical protein CO101_00490 [Candidatus Berkelbacteria bacterium CG_4_9_14_3_um_filter_39_23]|uniref:Tyrosine recombinase XerC n=1 Tax=Candidatus Berkelbacteria bacterium CG_4_9_14_3_um_filter_39_23 TaxID=1974508 RepID=A0A2M8C6F0_9BACT|nr:MAG: hypothetical protein COV39_02885 [Candidatus Berkelbacteria bacterium CG11_big_fil_rev_8_21_14_0_20_40_23]PIZ28853.1 MAG: hypothetical protein COY44_01975 [Candidatus Berkelbacteria bacterium CG_4_10_14_0_8_um_filter_39_42]PJB51875.1 MAG: hypothetical protein CO101_00490 [Candidatus Berkelbacteria bacterium CG_4_9_14_3_um_filter_39_23]
MAMDNKISYNRFMTIVTAIRQFLEHEDIEKGHSQLTIRNYETYLRKFLEFCEKQKVTDIDKVNQELIRQFRLHLSQISPPLKKNTRNYYLIALRSWLKYLQKRDFKVLSAEKIELAKVGERDIDILAPEELDRLLTASKENTMIGLRNKAILEMLFSTGLRLAEIACLNKSDIDLTQKEFSIRGKGDKVRLVFLSDSARTALENYLSKRQDENSALFINKFSSRLTPRSIERAVKQIARQAGISKKVTPHLLRHQFATDLLSSGADIRSVQTLLGHSSITTTQIYTHITNRDLRDVHSAFHGKQRRK